MFVFETVSIIVNLLLVVCVWLKRSRVQLKRNSRAVSIILYGFAALFFVNTIGNLFALSNIRGSVRGLANNSFECTVLPLSGREVVSVCLPQHHIKVAIDEKK